MDFLFVFLFCFVFFFLHLSHNGLSWQREVFCGPVVICVCFSIIIGMRCMLKTLTTTSTQWHKMKKKKAGVIGSTQYLM